MKKILMLLALLCVSSYVFAQDESPEGPGMMEMGLIVVEGAQVEKTDPRRIDKGADDLTRELVGDMHDLLRNEIGVTVNEGGRGGSNGFSMRGVDADRVAITVDDLPQAESAIDFIYSGYGYMSANRNTTELENLSRVSVAKGADSFKVGSGAVGGAVMFKTKEVADFVRPGEKVGMLLKTGYASKNDEWRHIIGGGFRLPTLEGLVQYTYRYGHEMKNYGKYPEDVTGRKRCAPDPVNAKTESILAKLGYNFWGEHWIRGFFENREQDRHVDEKSWSLTSKMDQRAVNEFAPYKRYGATYEWIPTQTMVEDLTFTYAHQDIDQHTHSVISQKSWLGVPRPPALKDRRIEQNLDSYALDMTTKHLMFWDTEHAFTFGAQYRETDFKNKVHDVDLFRGSSSTKSYITPVETKYYNIRLQDTIFWTYKLETVLGVRYDHYRHRSIRGEMVNVAYNATMVPTGSKTFAHPTGFANITYKITDNVAVQYKVGTAFRSPTALEMYFKFGVKEDDANQVHPNPELKPEKALNQEVAVMFEGALGSATLTGFYTDYTDFIADRQFTAIVPNSYFDPTLPPSNTNPKNVVTNNFKFVNIDKAKVYGAEFSGMMNLNELLGIIPFGTSLTMSMNWQEGDTSLGDGMRPLQPFKAVAGLSYDSPEETWGIHFTSRYLGAKKRKDTLQTTFGWNGAVQEESRFINKEVVLSDLRGYFRFFDRLTLSWGINNLFNKRYYTWDKLRSVPEFGTTGMVGLNGEGLEKYLEPGRNYSVALEYKF